MLGSWKSSSEEYTGEDGLLDGATTDAGKVTQAAVKARLREVTDDPDGHVEREALDLCLDLMKAHMPQRRRRRRRRRRSWMRRCSHVTRPLTAAEIAELVVDDKWMASFEGAIRQEVERLTGGLMDRVRVLEGRYAKPLPELARQVEDHGARVEGHLRRIGLPV